jgi:Fic family protein
MSANLPYYIHRHPDWPNFSFNAISLKSSIDSVTELESELSERLNSKGFRFKAELQGEVLRDAITDSWAIEGETLDNISLCSSIENKLSVKMLSDKKGTRNDDYYGGVVDVFFDIANDKSALSSEKLFKWHGVLLKKDLPTKSIGDWRKPEHDPMQVVSGRIGNLTVHYEAVNASRIPDEMDLFISWFNASSYKHAAIKAAISHLWFVFIHPFSDGNGRMARLLSDCAMSQQGELIRFFSFSSQVLTDRRDYYRIIDETQRSGDLDITLWIDWHTRTLAKAIQNALEKLAQVSYSHEFWKRANSFPINSNQKKVISKIIGEFHGYITPKKYSKITGVSMETAESELEQLVRFGLVDRKYLNPTFQNIFEASGSVYQDFQNTGNERPSPASPPSNEGNDR